jgi:hypothetical protein
MQFDAYNLWDRPRTQPLLVLAAPGGALAVQKFRFETHTEGMIMAGRYTFTKWLLQYQKEATAVGDLARQVSRDPEWTDPKTLAALESQLSGAGSPRATLEVARRAWRRFASDAGPRPKS